MKTNRPTSISVSYLCHSESSPNSRTAGQSTYHTVKVITANKCIHAPFYFKTRQERNEFCFPLLMFTMPFSLAFMFQVVQILVFRKTRVWKRGRPVFSNQKQRLPYSSCMDIGWSGEISSCPTCFPQSFSEVASSVKYWSTVSLLKVYVMYAFKENPTLWYFYTATENINNM